MRMSKGYGKECCVLRKLYHCVSRVWSALQRRSARKYRPYHKYSSISISITLTAMKGFSSRMNTKTFRKVDVISRPVYIRAAKFTNLSSHHFGKPTKRGSVKRRALSIYFVPRGSPDLLQFVSLIIYIMIILFSFSTLSINEVSFIIGFPSLFRRFLDNSADRRGILQRQLA